MNFLNISGLVLVSVFVIFFPCSTECWRRDRRPKIFGDRLPLSQLSPESKTVRQKISAYHNLFRSSVRPKASNMLEMSWHAPSAKNAQKWSDACKMLTHDNDTDRRTELYGSCGQNIFVATHKVPWYFAIESWYLEYMNFTYGSQKNDLSVVGHYTQMIWAVSHKVGCGFSKCNMTNGKPFYNYICNYCPTGNYAHVLGTPYTKGKPCADCPQACNTKTHLCTNSCPFGDVWINCQEMDAEHHQWLCLDKSEEGISRRKYCRATCFCKGKIIPNYSFNLIYSNETEHQNQTIVSN